MSQKTILKFRTLPQDLSALLEPTAKVVWLSKTQKLTRCLFSGVPAKRVDCLYRPDWDVVEIGTKTGMYGGDRLRITLRRDEYTKSVGAMPTPNPLPFGCLNILASPNEIKIVVATDAGQHVWPFARLRTELDGYDLGKIVAWHWTRYYRFIPHSEIEPILASFTLEFAGLKTLSAANQAASRALYELARNLGFRKLSSREQRKHEVVGQWHRSDSFAPSGRPDGNRAGVGEWTNESANDNKQYGAIWTRRHEEWEDSQ